MAIAAMLRETGWAFFLALALALLAGLGFFVLPDVLVSPHDLQVVLTPPRGSTPPRAPSATDLIQARNAVRTAAVALLAGIGAALATGFAARTYYLSRRSQVDLRYSTAIGQLDSGEGSAKVSAIAELGRIARESPARRPQIVAVLASFVRGYERDDGDHGAPLVLQEACSALVGRNRHHDRGFGLDLTGADLRQINLDGACLKRAILRDSKLAGAFLRQADLREADLTNASAQSARFDRARIDRAVFDGADLSAATLDGTSGVEASFTDTRFDSTFMRRARLRQCIDLPAGAAPKGLITDSPPAG